MKECHKILIVLILLTVFIFPGLPLLYAQQTKAEFTLEEIVVTAERRETSAQDTPVSVSAWDANALDEQNIGGAQDLQMRMPSTFVGATTVTIRGVGRSSGRLGIDPGVGLFADGFYNSEGTSWLEDMFDVERIENVRGPQSTLYGRATIGGAVNIINIKPTKEWSGQVKATIGNYEKRDFQTAFGGPLPLIDNLYYRILLSDRYYGGYQKNIFYKDEYQGTDDKWRVGVKLLYEPTEDLNFYFKYDVRDTNERPGATSVLDEWNTTDPNIWFPSINTGSFYRNPHYGLTMTNPTVHDKYKVAQEFPGSTSLDEVQVDLTTTLDVGNFTLKHLTFYRDWDQRSVTDYDEGPSLDVIRYMYIWGDAYEWSQELQLMYGGEDTPFRFIGGLYYYQRHRNMSNDLWYYGPAAWETFYPFSHPVLARASNPMMLSSDKTTLLPSNGRIHGNTMHIDDVAESVYAQIDYPIIDTLSLSVGGRYAIDMKKGDEDLWYYTIADAKRYLPPSMLPVINTDAAAAGKQHPGLLPGQYFNDGFPVFVYRFQAHSQSWSEFLWRAAIDYKPSDDITIYAMFNRGYKPGGFSLGSLQAAEFDAEYCNAYEAGWKQLWMEKRFSTSLSTYYYDYQGLQMTAMIDHVTQTSNASDSENYGAEVEFSGYLIENLLSSLSYSYMHTKFKEFDNQYDQYEPQKGYQDLNGNPLPYSPEHKISLNATYTLPTDTGDFVLHALYFWQSEVYTSHFTIPKRRADAYDRVDAELMWNSPAYKWRATLWIKNALDETTITTQTLLGPVSNFYNTVTFAPPRTFGIDISYKW